MKAVYYSPLDNPLYNFVALTYHRTMDPVPPWRLSLINASREWHRRMQDKEVQERLGKLGPNRPTIGLADWAGFTLRMMDLLAKPQS